MKVESVYVDWDNTYDDYDLTDGNLVDVSMKFEVALKYLIVHTATTTNKYQFQFAAEVKPHSNCAINFRNCIELALNSKA